MDEIKVTRRRPRRKKRIYPWFLLAYVVVFLIGIGIGLNYLNNYLQEYERSLPYNTTDSYLQSLTADHICQQASPVLDEIDTSVQTREEALAIMKSALAEPITFYKRVKECTDTKLVYALRCGTQAIGSFEMEQTAADEQGFTHWVVTEETFDLSFLLKEGFTLTVPHDATVSVNRNTLTLDNAIETDIRYDSIEAFYDEYNLPTMTTYQVGKHLGDLSVEVTDAKGNPIDPDADQSVFLDLCTEEEKTSLDHIAENFISRYIHFTSQTSNDVQGNLARLCEHIVPGGALEKRMRDAVRGLNWVTDRNVTIHSITVNQYVPAGNGRYICDIAYVVDTRDITGDVTSESSLFVIFKETANGLKAESMISQ